jgi:hypothetical protein
MNLSHNHEISDDHLGLLSSGLCFEKRDENLKQQVLSIIETEANPRLILNFLES